MCTEFTMATDQSLTSFNFEKLSMDNYIEWKFSMQMYLTGKDLWEIVSGAEVLADTADAEAKLKFKKRSNLALSAIGLGVKKDLQIYVRGCDSPKAAWDSLKNRFQESSLSKKILFRRKLYNTRLESGGDMETHVNELKTISEQLAAVGDPIDEKDLAMILMSSWPKEYNNLITNLETVGEDKLTWPLVRDRCVAEYERRHTKKVESKDEKALNTMHKQYKGNGRASHSQHTKVKRCFRCKDTSHVIRDCPKKKDSSNDNANVAAISEQFSDMYALTVDNNIKPDEHCRSSHWWLDSGCSRHMTPLKTDFTRYVKFQKPIHINLADETTILGYGIGDVYIKLFDGSSFIPVVIKNVLFVPKLQRKLLSISDITDKGSIVTFEGNTCTLQMEGKEFLLGQKFGKLWRLYCDDEECFAVSVDSFKSKSSSTELWHQRYGHMSDGYLDILKRKDMVEGFSCEKKGPNTPCEGCIYGKHSRTPFPKQSLRTTHKPLELIHTDVCGPISIPSIGGSRYFITFIDNFSRYTTTYLMKHKDEALSKFKEFVAMSETKFECKVKKVRSDGGGEYCSKVFDDFLKERGTQDERTIPYSPQQNGTAERMNRTLMDKVRSMLYHSNLPLHFWGEALATATYLSNRSPTSTLEETPFERWHGTKPDISNLRVFGCVAYAHIPDEKRKKLDKKSKKCIFVGYPPGKKGYKLFDPITRKMLYSRDVIFVETVFDHSIEKIDEPDELLPAICFGFDTEEEQNTDVDIYDNERNDNENDETTRDDIRNADDEEVPPRRTKRNVTAPDFYGETISHRFGKWEQIDVNIASVGMNDPKSYRQAMNGHDSIAWKAATDAEVESLSKNNTWDLVDLPPGKSIVGCKWVLKTKFNADGTLNKRKARLVAQGFSQQHGIDYDEVFAPVVKYTSLRTVFAIANQFDMDIHQMDVKSAYLNGDIDHDIYMKQPEGYIDPENPTKVCKLNKGLYGLKQGARLWNEKIDGYLKSHGFVSSDADPCIYVKVNEGKILIIALYVDDTILASNCNKMLLSAKEMLHRKFEMSDLGEVKSILGMSIDRNREKGILYINQKSYFEEILRNFGMEDCKPVSTPMEPGKQFEKTPDDKDGVDTQRYQSIIGSLIYASIATRPDLSVTVSRLSQHMSKPNEDHWAAIKRVLRYLKGTLDFGLIFKRTENFELIGYSDADWAGDIETRKSTSGYVFLLGGNPISWTSKKQPIVALSTTEAEYIALCLATQESVWLRQLLSHLKQKPNGPTIINEDNQGTICISKNIRNHSRTKHIDIKYHYIRECIQQGLISMKYCETKIMVAHIFTKGLAKPGFIFHRESMNIGN